MEFSLRKPREFVARAGIGPTRHFCRRIMIPSQTINHNSPQQPASHFLLSYLTLLVTYYCNQLGRSARNIVQKPAPKYPRPLLSAIIEEEEVNFHCYGCGASHKTDGKSLQFGLQNWSFQMIMILISIDGKVSIPLSNVG